MFLAGNGSLAVEQMRSLFRIFNPILQGEKFDKEEYVKKWLPELQNLPKKFIHKPGSLMMKI